MLRGAGVPTRPLASTLAVEVRILFDVDCLSEEDDRVPTDETEERRIPNDGNEQAVLVRIELELLVHRTKDERETVKLDVV